MIAARVNQFKKSKRGKYSLKMGTYGGYRLNKKYYCFEIRIFQMIFV